MHVLGGPRLQKKLLLRDIWWQMTQYHFKIYVFWNTMLCCLAHSYCCFRGSKLLQNVSHYSMIEMTSHPTRSVSSTPMSEPQILKCHFFVSCLEITNINIGTNNGILNTN